MKRIARLRMAESRRYAFNPQLGQSSGTLSKVFFWEISEMLSVGLELGLWLFGIFFLQGMNGVAA